MPPYPKPEYWRSKKYLDFVKTLNCCVCMMPKTIPHHVRFAYNSGTGTKPSDYWCVPLCHDCHLEIHTQGVKTFCDNHGVDIYKEIMLVNQAWIRRKYA